MKKKYSQYLEELPKVRGVMKFLAQKEIEKIEVNTLKLLYPPTKHFIAIQLSGDKEVWCETEEEAWEYVLTQCCEDCKKDGTASACAMEWDVWTKEQYSENVV